eukprot:3957065-Pyramimonas_sp.AAC.1
MFTCSRQFQDPIRPSQFRYIPIRIIGFDTGSFCGVLLWRTTIGLQLRRRALLFLVATYNRIALVAGFKRTPYASGFNGIPCAED